MRPDRIVVATPSLDEDLGFPERAEYSGVQQLVAKPGTKNLAVPVLPRRAWLDEGGLGADGADPCAHLPGDEFGAIVGPFELRWTPQDEQVRQGANLHAKVTHLGGL